MHESERADCPRVSVVTPFLNNEAYLAEAIESVIAQSFDGWEYLLVDDGSGSAATAIAKDYAAHYPGKIRYLEHPGHVNRGISATRNLGVQHARGELIAFLDSDDVWLPSKLADHVAILDAHQEVGMVCGATVIWRSWSGGVDRIHRAGHRMQNMVVYPPDAAVQLFPLGDDYSASFSDVVFRAALVRQLGGFENQFNGLYDDQVLLLKVYLSIPVYFCSTISNKYRQHPTSICNIAHREGRTAQATLFFLEWLERYLKTLEKVDARVESSLYRALRPFRHPHIHYFLSTSMKVYWKSRRLTGRAIRLPAKVIREVKQRKATNGQP
jgi:glycosyltransferase involved in cell wall biosynthesis